MSESNGHVFHNRGSSFKGDSDQHFLDQLDLLLHRYAPSCVTVGVASQRGAEEKEEAQNSCQTPPKQRPGECLNSRLVAFEAVI